MEVNLDSKLHSFFDLWHHFIYYIRWIIFLIIFSKAKLMEQFKNQSSTLCPHLFDPADD